MPKKAGVFHDPAMVRGTIAGRSCRLADFTDYPPKAPFSWVLTVAISEKCRKAFHDERCFRCQQSAEKFLKGLLEELGQNIPKTHDLLALQNLLLPHHPTLRALLRSLAFLTDFAVETRYPGASAVKRQAVAAERCAGKVRTTCRRILGIRDTGQRRKP